MRTFIGIFHHLVNISDTFLRQVWLQCDGRAGRIRGRLLDTSLDCDTRSSVTGRPRHVSERIKTDCPVHLNVQFVQRVLLTSPVSQSQPRLTTDHWTDQSPGLPLVSDQDTFVRVPEWGGDGNNNWPIPAHSQNEFQNKKQSLIRK